MKPNLRSACAALALAVSACAMRPSGPCVEMAAAVPAAPSPSATPPPQPPPPTPTPIADRYRDVAARILDAARTKSRAYEKLAYLCDRIGNRLSGSDALDRAVAWAEQTLRDDGLDARAEPVMVPAWIRGEESCELVTPRRRPLHMLGLGNSVGTPEAVAPDLPGIAADVVPVRDFDELEKLGDAVRGKIVLYTARMPAFDEQKGTGYGETVVYRVAGPSRAAAHGAVAALVRSVTASSAQSPHTGMLRYDEKQPKIPAAALSTEDADFLERLCASGEPVRVRLTMQARFGPDHPCANVVGELRGREKPDEVVVIGGHLDSWDVGQGAHDDGGPAMACAEALRLLKSLGLAPRRTLRVVLFVNEENGLAGGRGYAERHKDELSSHVAAIEADSGVARPLGLTTAKPVDERDARRWARLADLLTLLRPIGASRLTEGGGGADIGPMTGVPQLGFSVDESHYFDWHHTEADTLDKVSKEWLDLDVAAIATIAYVLADMDERLGE